MAKRRILGEGGIDQLPSGSFRARINDNAGRRSRAFLTKSEALDWLAHKSEQHYRTLNTRSAAHLCDTCSGDWRKSKSPSSLAGTLKNIDHT